MSTTASSPRLAQLELECMKVLWKQPGASVAQVRAGLPRPLAHTTVMTVLERMSAKGVVSRRKNGRAYLYSPVLDLEAARTQAVRQLLRNLFENDTRTLIQYLSTVRPATAGQAAIRAEKPAQRRARATDFSPPRMDDSLL